MKGTRRSESHAQVDHLLDVAGLRDFKDKMV